MTYLTTLLLAVAAPVPPGGHPVAVLIDTQCNPADRQAAALLKQQVGVLKSEPILRAALKRPEVAGLECVKKQANAVAWAQKNLEVEVQEKQGILRVWTREG